MADHAELFLSQWRFNPRLRPVQQALADSHDLHRLVMSAFPQAAPGEDARQAFGVLYRIDPDEKTGVPLLLLQSRVRPDWSMLAPLLLAPPAEEPKEVGAIYETLSRGSLLRFRLRANPTRRIPGKRADDKLAGKRVNLRSDEERQVWLARKLSDIGCQLGSCTIRPGLTQRGRRNGQTVSHSAVVFDGVLRVEDADRLRAGIREGIGAGKAYGFGLLSLAPVR
jgi:CRISPR system Cascade subunit CasE